MLLLDRPTSALDPTTTGRSKSSSDRSRTHGDHRDPNVPRPPRISDRAALFFDGRLVEEGPTEQLFLLAEACETIRRRTVGDVKDQARK